MNIIIIEDEFRAAKSLQNLVLDLRPDSRILGVYDSIEASIDALSKDMKPDLIFMDIHLSDGLSFEIFKAIEITCPVVFCTAFDQYMLDAFKSKGVDYVLKPFSREDIAEALKKVDELKNSFKRMNFSIWNHCFKKSINRKVRVIFLFLKIKNIRRFLQRA